MQCRDLVGNDEFNCEFEKWLLEKLKSYNSDVDESLVTYISSIVCDEDSEIEEKIESIAPILEELNQNSTFDEHQLAKEITDTWTKMKLEFTNSESKNKSSSSQGPDSLSTISSMIKSHELKVETKKKSNTNDFIADYGDDDQDDEKPARLMSNTNAADAAAVEKAKRDKIALTHLKQKEQTKKAAIEQKEREEEKKKKAKEKVAKQERRR